MPLTENNILFYWTAPEEQSLFFYEKVFVGIMCEGRFWKTIRAVNGKKNKTTNKHSKKGLKCMRFCDKIKKNKQMFER